MNSTLMMISIAILVILYPFFLYYTLNSLQNKLSDNIKELEKLLKKYKNEDSTELSEEIHKKRRAYNTIVRVNNHKLDSMLGKLLAKKYDFKRKGFFKFQGR